MAELLYGCEVNQNRKFKKVLILSVTAVLLAGLSFSLGVFITNRKVQKKELAIKAQSAAADNLLFEWDGKPIRFSDLDAPTQKNISQLRERRGQGHFDVDFHFHRDIERVVKTQAVGRYFAAESKRTSESVEQLQEKKLSVPESTAQDALDLYEASDPTAKPKDFKRLAPELQTYINDVARRAAFDRLVRELVASKRLKIALRIPERGDHKIQTDGFPAAGVAGNSGIYGNSGNSGTVPAGGSQLELVNFTDFLCDECSEYNINLAAMVAKYGTQVKFVFVPFPFSRPDKSIGLARGAMCAQAQDRYLDYHMAALSLGTEVAKSSALSLARRAKLDVEEFSTCYKKGTGVSELLAVAQREANAVGVLATPVSFLQGQRYEGTGALAELEKKLTK